MNTPLSEKVFMINRERAIDYLNTRKRLYVVDGFAGWDPKHRLKIRVVCARAYHGMIMSVCRWHMIAVTGYALFMCTHVTP